MASEEKRNKNCKLTIAQEKELCQKYQDGVGSTILSQEYNIHPTSVNNILKVYNIPRRTLKEARNNYLKRTLNENFFHEIDSPEKAYWLGVMFSDGYINETHEYTNYMGISVQIGDKAWLERFRDDLNYSGDVNVYKQTVGYAVGSEYARLLIGNNQLVEDLKSYGITSNKSYEDLHMPDINFKDDFIRGLFDGDGSLKKVATDIRLCGCKSLMIEVGNYLGYDYKLYPDKSIWDLTFNRFDSKQLERRLYENATVYLQRKYDIAKRSFNSPYSQE